MSNFAVQAIRILCANDKSGNPRRGWLVALPSGACLFVPEGYVGPDALKLAVEEDERRRPTGFFATVAATSIHVGPAEYNRLKKLPHSHAELMKRRALEAQADADMAKLEAQGLLKRRQ